MKKSINMENLSNIENELYCFFNIQVKNKEIKNYLNTLVFENLIEYYALYSFENKSIIYDYNKIIKNLNNDYLEIMKRVLLHEIRHAEQRKITQNYSNVFVAAILNDSISSKYNDYIYLPHETDADIYSFIASIIDCNKNDKEAMYNRIIKLYNLIRKKFKNNNPTKEFYASNNELNKYYYFLNKIKNNYLKIQYGLELDEKIMYEIEQSLDNPIQFVNITSKNFLM